MHYLVGDIQGCDGALDRLLEKIDFSPSRDRVYVLGDLVNRGPGSLATLRRLRDLGESATCVLGNHDWHLLAVAAGVRPRHRSDTIDDILDAPDREAWLDWLRQRRMAVFEQGWLMLHAGVVPQWDLATTLGLAGELEHGALWHVPGGYGMRDLLEGSHAIVPSTSKIGPAGSAIDIPLHHRVAAYVRSHFDTLEVRVADAPRPDEILFVIAMSTGARPHARVGGLRVDEISKFDGNR